jgi:ABC-type cobalamin/Fe3+-siderophores transport system ATPase subunit
MTVLAASHLVVKRNGATLLRDVSLSFGGTGSVAVIGPNGAGKSTLLRALAGLAPPSGGGVLLGDRNLASIPSAARARTIGFLPQHFDPHWDLTVRQLLQLGAERATHLAADALSGIMIQFELGRLEGRRWSTLSGGERARVLLATVLVVDPPILLADEPTAALDIRHRLEVIHALAARGRAHLSVVVVHDLDLAFSAFERVILMAGGEIVADEPAARLIDDPRLDGAFGVRFDRMKVENGWLLRARLTS